MPLRLSLSQFVSEVQRECKSALCDPRFCSQQAQLLDATLDRFLAGSAAHDWGQPLGLFYAVYRCCGRARDGLAILLGKFCVFYILAADLFDDVQDDDLDGKPHHEVGPAIATNSALALLCLALDALGEASELEEEPAQKLTYLRLFNRVSLIAVSAQHRDLQGQKGAMTRQEVEDMQRGKTSSLALLCECAAWAGGGDAEHARLYHTLGEELCAAVQVIDDVRDLVAKEESIDLATGKWTYPLACFVDKATGSDRDRLEELLKLRPIPQTAIVELLESTGAFDECARAVERHRLFIFELLAKANAQGAHRRLIGEIVDHLASALYCPASVEEHQCPPSSLLAVVDRSARRFEKEMCSFGFGGSPPLVPWHLPLCLYDPEQRHIFISDVRELPEEVVPFHAELSGASADDVRVQLEKCLPFLVAHELAHAWRDQLGRLSEDAWHEEYVANALAWLYVECHDPTCADAVLSMSRRLVERHERRSDEWRALSRRARQQSVGVDYDLSPEDAALVHATMIATFAKSPPCTLEEAIHSWFDTAQVLAAE